MSKRTIKLEFEFVSKPFIEPTNGAEGEAHYIKPVGNEDFWARLLKTVDEPTLVSKSIAGMDQGDSLSMIAMQMRDWAAATAAGEGLSVEFSEMATFHMTATGEVKEIKPATFTPH